MRCCGIAATTVPTNFKEQPVANNRKELVFTTSNYLGNRQQRKTGMASQFFGSANLALPWLLSGNVYELLILKEYQRSMSDSEYF